MADFLRRVTRDCDYLSDRSTEMVCIHDIDFPSSEIFINNSVKLRNTGESPISNKPMKINQQ